ncbi:MAG: energy transducer TonB [Chitinophagales bacterium]
MSEHKLHIEKGGYISKDLMLAYLNGNLSDAEKLHVEQLIAGDAFLADAIEGLRGADTIQIEQTLNTIYKNVDHATGENKPFTISTVIRKYAAAAMILVFFGVTFLIMNRLNKSTQDADIALEPDIENKINSTEVNDGMGAGDTQIIENTTPATSKNNADEITKVQAQQIQVKSITIENEGYDEIALNKVSVNEEVVQAPTATSQQEDLFSDKAELDDAKDEVVTTLSGASDGVSYSYTTGPVVIGEVLTDTEAVKFESKQDKKSSGKVTPATTADYDVAITDSVSVIVDKKPEYPGGLDALNKYLAAKIDLSKIETFNGTLYVSFSLDASGNVYGAVITTSINATVDAAVLKAIQGMPKWKPARKNNKTVGVQLNMPIYFTKTP